MVKKIIVIHQPDFAPHISFFHRFLHADMFIALDHVQFLRRGWMNRDRIKTSNGEKWLTVSIDKTSQTTPINKVSLSDQINWRQNNLNLLEENYIKSTGYSELMPEIEKIYNEPFKILSDFNMSLIDMLMDMLGVRIPWVFSSSLDPVGAKNELLIDLLQKVSATHYLSGIGAEAYLNDEFFKKAQIEIIWQKYSHPIYKQQYGEFIPHLSVLDLIFNNGIEVSRDLLRRSK